MPIVRILKKDRFKAQSYDPRFLERRFWEVGQEIEIPFGKELKQLVEGKDVMILRPAPRELKTRCEICLHRERRAIERIYHEAGGYREAERRLEELGYHNKKGEPFAIRTIHTHFKDHPRLEEIEAKYPKPPEGLDIREAEERYGRFPPMEWWKEVAKKL